MMMGPSKEESWCYSVVVLKLHHAVKAAKNFSAQVFAASYFNLDKSKICKRIV
jgi:hypothetical protein